MSVRDLLAHLCPCCRPEELEPLRVSHANGISSSDRLEHGAGDERSAREVAAEARRQQEWCVQHLGEGGGGVELAAATEDSRGPSRPEKPTSAAGRAELRRKRRLAAQQPLAEARWPSGQAP